MNKKLIAMAVTATLAAPLVTQADEMEKSVTLYGRINNALTQTKPEGGDSATDLSNISSRFGIKYKADIGNGMTASARYEFSTATDKELQGGTSLVETAAGDISRDRDRFALDTRIGTVGLSGAFGAINLGNQWSAFYNTVGSIIDPIYTLGGVLYGLAGGPYRSSNTAKYSNSFGPVSLEVDARFNGSNEGNDVAEGLAGDGFGIGLNINATENLLIAVAFDGEDRDDDSVDTDRTGIALKGTFGSFWGSVGYQNTEDNLDNTEVEQTQLWVGTSFGATSVTAGYGILDGGGDIEPSAFNLGVYHKIGGGLKVYYEGLALDSDGAGADLDVHIVGLRVDF